MMEKILTISIAAYNVEAYIEKTLSSLVCDSAIMEKLEILVVDDGSTDGTSKIVQKYVEKYPDTFFLIKKRNGGHGSTLNTSVIQAHGKYFKMLDGDDWYETAELEKLVLALENVEEDVILSPYHRVDMAKGKIEMINRHQLEIGRVYNIAELNNQLLDNVHAHELTVRTELLQTHQFHVLEQCVFTDDEYVFWAIMYAKTYLKLQYFVYRYQIGIDGQTVSESGRRKHWLDAKRIVIDMLKLLQNRKKDILCDFHKMYLYRFIQHTADFQCENFYFAETVKEVKRIFAEFIEEMNYADSDFCLFFQNNSEKYQWMHWIFSLAEKLNGKQCFIFGAGNYGKKAYRIFDEENVEVVGIIDNNSLMWGKRIGKVDVLDPRVLINEYNQKVIVLAVKKGKTAIKQQLIDMRIPEENIWMLNE